LSTALFTHDVCVLHQISPGHPEQPARIQAVTDQLKADNLYNKLLHREAPFSSPSSGSQQLDPDTAMNPHSLDASRRAAGAGIEAVTQVLQGEYTNAFCAVRPPGHHAEREQAMGFCFFGSVAVAALHALDVLGLDRVAIVDFDVHHGNGTEDLVANDKRILFCSSFQHPFYPGYFRESVSGQRINVPLPAGTGSENFRTAIKTQWILASMELGDDDFEWITRELAEVADRHAGGRIVSMLEGGYSLAALGRSAARHTQVLMEL